MLVIHLRAAPEMVLEIQMAYTITHPCAQLALGPGCLYTGSWNGAGKPWDFRDRINETFRECRG